jgi:NADP-dependent 3-hydroxy acid dehydrogenase YdfG
MITVGITGHTCGLGKSIFAAFDQQDYNTIGFSRSNGFDISKESVRQSILNQPLDIFVNNAYHSFGQTALLYDLINAWDNTNKLIINISSKGSFLPVGYNQDIYIKEVFEEYISEKRKQNNLINSRIFKSRPHILNIVVGPIDTNFEKTSLVSPNPNLSKLDPNKIASLILDLVKYRDSIQIQEIILDTTSADWHVL